MVLRVCKVLRVVAQCSGALWSLYSFAPAWGGSLELPNIIPIRSIITVVAILILIVCWYGTLKRLYLYLYYCNSVLVP